MSFGSVPTSSPHTSRPNFVNTTCGSRPSAAASSFRKSRTRAAYGAPEAPVTPTTIRGSPDTLHEVAGEDGERVARFGRRQRRQGLDRVGRAGPRLVERPIEGVGGADPRQQRLDPLLDGGPSASSSRSPGTTSIARISGRVTLRSRRSAPRILPVPST